MFENFWGNAAVTESLEQMIGRAAALADAACFPGAKAWAKPRWRGAWRRACWGTRS